MAAVLDRGLFDPHVNRLRETYRAKIDAVLRAMEEHLARWGPRVASTGRRFACHFWVRLPPSLDTGVDGPCSIGRLPKACSTCRANTAIPPQAPLGRRTCSG